MQILLKAKHYQVFIILIIGLIINKITIEGDQIYSALLSVIGFWIYFSYPFIIGVSLHGFIAPNIKLNNTLYQINFLIFMATMSIVSILSDGQGMTFKGLAAIPVLYFFYAFLHYISFTAKIIKTIELGRVAKLNDYIGEFFLLVFLPIGIWFLQPRINRIIRPEEK
ncbi:hypothetical protein [Carboxylicivirga linearis]|uniref:DUF962 domain-containing protein n=1 Tax=Carboxylicivirga linearis TaxID=1628157 RepID=A0ABS5K225_9BACT|nr:hypothetical protein [Carboxylicivirga linearis]MBS2101223.1 hypothetical protein [Carboxylicivirga linearis]